MKILNNILLNDLKLNTIFILIIKYKKIQQNKNYFKYTYKFNQDKQNNQKQKYSLFQKNMKIIAQKIIQILFSSKKRSFATLFVIFSFIKYRKSQHKMQGKYYIETLTDPKDSKHIFKCDILHYQKKQKIRKQSKQQDDLESFQQKYPKQAQKNENDNNIQKILKKIVSHHAFGNLLSHNSPNHSPLIKKITKSKQINRQRKNSIKHSLNDLQELEKNESNEIFLKKTKKLEKLYAENDCDLTMVFIPGFPGIIKCYDNFLGQLHREIGETIDIFAIGYINMANHKDRDNQTYTIQENIRHKTLFLQKLIKENPKRRFIFLAHSLGSYISLRTIQNLPDQLVFKAYLLYPCINEQFQKTFLVKLGYLGHIYKPTHLLVKFLWFLLTLTVPKFLVRGFLRSIWINEEMTESVVDLFNYQNATMVNSLYKEAMHHTQTKDDNMILKSIDKCVYYFGKTDNVIPLNSADHLTLQYPKVECQVNKTGIPHNFSMFHYKQQAQITGQQITEDIDQFEILIKKQPKTK